MPIRTTPRKDVKSPDDDLMQIMQEKLSDHKLALLEHEEAMEYHAEQVRFHKGRVEFIEGVLQEMPAPVSNGRNGHEDEGNYDKGWFWEKRIPQLMESHFHGKEFRNMQIIKAENVPNIDKEAVKKNVRYAVSLALTAMYRSGILSRRKEDGVKGYVYKKK